MKDLKIIKTLDPSAQLRKNYMLGNWNAYNLVDTKEQFIALLNILDVFGENLDTLHDVAFNHHTGFCGLKGRFRSDRQVVEALFSHNKFFPSSDDFFNYYVDHISDNTVVYVTADGYVVADSTMPRSTQLQDLAQDAE